MVYFSQVGSGTIPFIAELIPSGERGIGLNTGRNPARGHRAGDQVLIGNPEDIVAVDAFAVSGVTVGTTPLEVLAFGRHPLPRSRSVRLVNDGTAIIRIAHSAAKTAEGFPLYPVVSSVGQLPVEIPLLKNVSIWAASDSGNNSLRMIIV